MRLCLNDLRVVLHADRALTWTMFQTPFKGAVADGFPAEHVTLQVVGGGGGGGALSE